MCGSQKFVAETRKPFGEYDLDDLGLHSLEATLVYFVFNDKLFVFCNLTQLVDYIGSDGGLEGARILKCNKLSGTN